VLITKGVKVVCFHTLFASVDYKGDRKSGDCGADFLKSGVGKQKWGKSKHSEEQHKIVTK
jgi:hypothetical protein